MGFAKLIVPISVTVFMAVQLGHQCEGACQEGMFAVDDSTCCPMCREGFFVKSNCSVKGNTNSGMRCHRCRKCESGQKTVANCTLFSDRVCEDAVTPSLSTSVFTVMGHRSTVDQSKSEIYHISLYVTFSVFLLLVVVATVWKWCATNKSPKDPASEPLKV